MFFLRSVRRRPEFRAGAVEMTPMALGIGAWGLMTGVAMVQSGMSVIEAVAMTLLVYAGSSQLAAIPLLVAGAPAWVVLATGFCVNLRFVVFSLHLRPYLMHQPRWRRLVNGYMTADLSYVMFTRRFPQPAADGPGREAQEAYLAGGYAITWLAWMSLSLIGVGLANFIPLSWGLGFAGVLSLVAILCSMATSALRGTAIAIAGATAVAAYHLPLKLNIVAAIGVAVLLCFWFEKRLGLAPEAEDR
ncbi:MAG: branched-chain amino acid ABC transporter permease [Comamonadaceae bacterium]|nr:MAG: branched-chain amino acid ABC transporter permease [Comamonadaceae bacterium]